MGTKIIIIIVILVLIFGVYLLCTGASLFKKKEDKSDAGKIVQDLRALNPLEKRNTSNKPAKPELHTMLVPDYNLLQLDAQGRTAASFPIANVPEIGLTVSRPGAAAGDIILSDKTGDMAMTVGTEAIVIAKDEKGYFAQIFQNGKNKNKVYLYNRETKKSEEVTSFDITDGTLICIGRQWLKFVSNSAPSFIETPAPQQINTRVDNPVNAPVPPQGGSVQNEKPANQGQMNAPSGFTFETSVGTDGRYVITRNK